MITTEKEHREVQSRIFLNVVTLDAKDLYREKEKQYSDSWRDMSGLDILNRLKEEYNELELDITFGFTESSYKECLDVINVATMLAHKIKEETDKK